MNQLIWDDINAWTLEELITEGASHTQAFSEFFLQKLNQDSEDKNVNSDIMKRYCSVATLLFRMIADYYPTDSYQNDAEKLNCWILLGSLTESTLQMFLCFYIKDYAKSKWQQWDDFNGDEVVQSIKDSLNELTKKGKITAKQKRSIIDAVKDKIEEHTVEHDIKWITLDELIQFYQKTELIDDEEYNYLHNIQLYRNGVHSFLERSVGDWKELVTCSKFLCYMQQWIMNRLPCDSGIEALANWILRSPNTFVSIINDLDTDLESSENME